MSKGYVRHGFGTVRPYLYGPYETPDFMATVFGAQEIERHEASGRRAAHVELAIGDSAVVVEAGELPAEHEPTEGSVYVYVEDVDAVYQSCCRSRRRADCCTGGQALRRARLRIQGMWKHLVGGDVPRKELSAFDGPRRGDPCGRPYWTNRLPGQRDGTSPSPTIGGSLHVSAPGPGEETRMDQSCPVAYPAVRVCSL